MLPKDLAQRWRCSEKHVRKMINTGQLRGIRLGGKLLRVRLEDVEAYEAAGVEFLNHGQPGVRLRKPEQA